MNRGRKVSLGLIALDTIALAVCFNFSAWLRGMVDFSGWIIGPLIIPLLLLGIALYLIDAYKRQTDMLSLDYASQHVIAVLAAMLATLLLTFVVFPSGYPLQQSRAVVASGFVLLAPLSLGYRRLVYAHVLRERWTRSIVFVGDMTSARFFREECHNAGMKQPVIATYAGTGATLAPFVETQSEPLILFSDVIRQIQRGELAVEAIVLKESSRELVSDVAQQLVDLYFKGVPTYTLELFNQVYWRKIPLYRLNQTWLFQEGFDIAREPVFERMKRLSDIAFAIFGLILAAPILAVAALAIWCEDRQPPVFKQKRIGRNRVPFTAYKLRTMRMHAGGNAYAQVGDLRITRVGRFLRASRLDELPQLWNVLRGEMSLIGPRAEWDQLVAGYEREIPCYHFRHLVRPGITGWAQVNFTYGASVDDTLRKLEYDLYYIRHFSFTLDASIVLKTIHVMLFGKGR